MVRNKVTKCVCHHRTFEELKAYAEEHNLTTVEELQDRDMCSCGCQMCKPYVELMLETGETEFAPGAYYKRNSKSGN